MPRIRYVTLTIERLKKKDADKIVLRLVEEFGAITVFVRPYEDEPPGAPEAA